MPMMMLILFHRIGLNYLLKTKGEQLLQTVSLDNTLTQLKYLGLTSISGGLPSEFSTPFTQQTHI